jgi:hypothetical protein
MHIRIVFPGKWYYPKGVFFLLKGMFIFIKDCIKGNLSLLIRERKYLFVTMHSQKFLKEKMAGKKKFIVYYFLNHKSYKMKKLLFLFGFMLAAILAFTQTPQQFNSHTLAFNQFKKSGTGTITDAWLNQAKEFGIVTDKPAGDLYSLTRPFAVINGSGTLNFIPKFTPSGIEIGNSQIFDNGTNIGINTTSPTYKLHIIHGGSTGILNKSSASFSAIDIDGFTGDAALRFYKAGSTRWNIRNRPTNDDFEFFESGSGSRMIIQNATGNVGINFNAPTAKLHVGGNITSTGIKAFTIDHPLDPENKMLHHFALESNEVLNSYSGNVFTNAKGKAIVKLPEYFEAINKDFRYQLTVIGSLARSFISKEVSGNTFEITTDEPNVKVSWEVKGVRSDGYMKNVNKMEAEEMKPAAMKGKYVEPKSYNLPESRGVNYDAKAETGSSADELKPVTDKVVGSVRREQ